MSYQVLARKWRPKTFNDVVGQRHVLTALSNSLRENRLHHSYLFSGTRGVGKTSIARLFAKGLNCINGVTAEPCGHCEHCKAIEEGRFIDLIEIDAASRTKVEDTRELLDNVQYKPVQGRYKVYLIDEVHMLSRHSFNALLKTLEEPPEYVKFLLATTDPHKLPITILSRCMQFHLKALESTQIKSHLMNVLNAEEIPFEEVAIEKLAKAAQGSIRDSLSLTDQAIAISNGNVTFPIVQDMLGLLDDSQAIDILYAIQLGDGEGLIRNIQSVAEKSGGWYELLDEIAETLHKIAMLQLLPTSSEIIDSALTILAKQISPEDIQFLYQVIITGKKELTFSPNPRIGVEMILLRALAFHPKAIGTNIDEVSLSSKNESEVLVSPSNTLALSSSETNQHHSFDKPKEEGIHSQLTKNLSVNDSVSTQEKSLLNSSPAFSALEALEQLDVVAIQKKNTEQPKLEVTNSFSFVEKNQLLPTHHNLVEEKLNKLQSTLQDDLSDKDVGEDLNELAITDDYHWEYSDLGRTEEKIISSSDIRKKVLEDTSPELENRITDLVITQDEWTKLIENLDIIGLTKELASNCIFIEQIDGSIRLGLRREYSHLKQRYSSHLQKALSDFYDQDIKLIIEENIIDKGLTPNEYRKRVYQSFMEQAQKDLQSDENLKLLQKEFNAQLELSTVRPI
ncbi:DNA polymerase III gamma subunit /DNA polymerase III tau subunit [Bisgaardia hudsonensis]|uniref:DNA polymerase III subunit gamma/tau n=1 Tax=Bisgaardia hudsonensis TaxID=109472 RepID=A0A4R2N0F3_9PAST|nr:DNA polymerase III subunit gamma/tau [Bisgaardia hudsonensis]QLB13450.1 DNA polymerase III subunit gamma/tau [Bisgaardia hudsonensis]TCP12859.1 DNA polymerase III gamma subunit /DNA polymerase III tau subunit [Bisgaardia hudsonensis]